MPNCMTGLTTVLLLAAVAPGAEIPRPEMEWPGFRGQGDSHAHSRELPITWESRGRSAGNWTIRLPGYGQSSPVIFGDQVFVTSVSGDKKEHLHVLGIDVRDGTTRWQRDFTATQQVTDGDTVSRAAPTPVVDAERLYVMFESGDLVALSHAGETVWQRSLVKDYGEFKGPHGYASSPALAQDRLILQVAHAGPSYVLAVDPVTGENRWKVDHPSQTGWSTPVVYQHGEVTGVIVSTSGSVRGYNVDDGRELWFVRNVQGNSTASPTVAGDLVVIGCGGERQGGGRSPRAATPNAEGPADATRPARPEATPAPPGSLAIRLGGTGDVTDSHVAWRAAKVSAGYASPVVSQELAYFVNRVGGVQAVNLSDGEIRWQHRLPGSAWASPVLVGDRVFFFCKDGAVVALGDGPTLEEIGENSLSATDVVYGIAAAEQSWFIRTGRGLLRISHTPTE